jgi:hypothetical protein
MRLRRNILVTAVEKRIEYFCIWMTTLPRLSRKTARRHLERPACDGHDLRISGTPTSHTGPTAIHSPIPHIDFDEVLTGGIFAFLSGYQHDIVSWNTICA